jgi:hypothetical protein
VLVLDSKRISRSPACRSGNFEIGTGFHFGQPFQPFEHDLAAAMPLCDLAVQLKVGPPTLASLPSVKIIFGNLEYLLRNRSASKTGCES